MQKGDILQATRAHIRKSCFHYVVFLEMNPDNQSFKGACISSKPSKPTDLLSNIPLRKSHFYKITPRNNYTVTYGNNSTGKSYLCKCKFPKDLSWYVDYNSKVKVVGRLTKSGIKRVENALKKAPKAKTYFTFPLSDVNTHPSCFIWP